MDFRVPVRRTCETEKNAESGHVREVWTQDADIRVGAKIVKCKRKQASDYHDRDEVEVRLMGRDDWVEAVVVSAPALGAVHNPWIGVTVPGDPNVKYVTVNRVRDRTERRVLAAERARRAMDENENARKALVAKRAEDRKSKGAQADEERRRLWNAGDARRDKFLLQFVRGGADPLAMLRASERELKGVKPLTDEEADRLPEAYTRLLGHPQRDRQEDVHGLAGGADTFSLASKTRGKKWRNVGKDAAARGVLSPVYHGVAQKTPGGLTSADLTKNKRKHIVPIAKMEAGRDAYNRIEDWVGFSKRVHKMIGGDYKSALKMAKKLTDDYLRDANLPATAENKRKFWTEYVADHDLPDEDARISPVLEDDDGF
eukprot:jgi/Mesvir1/28522/Mv04264-RA.1